MDPGCGKTTLAKKLEEFCPENYKRTITTTTRKMRDGEIDGDDYKFLSDEEFDELRNNGLFFETVEHQFLPFRYGGEKSELTEDKVNIIVASIEGFLSSVRQSDDLDVQILVNILNDDVLDIEREGRNPQQEENINLSVLRNLLYEYKGFVSDNYLEISGKIIKYIELNLSELKTFRNNKTKLLKYFNENILDEIQ